MNAILKVARIGHPVVRAAASPVPAADIASPGFQRLVDDMVATMHEYEGVGLAAPQVHVSLRVAVIEVQASDERSHAAVPLTVLVNPVVDLLWLGGLLIGLGTLIAIWPDPHVARRLARRYAEEPLASER